MLDKGYVQVYTGNGKGKTTAALGLTLRALCAGFRVFFGQFMKGQDYSELKAVERFENLELVQFGTPEFVRGEPSETDKEQARAGLERMERALESGEYDVVVFDEVNTAMHFKLLSVAEVLGALAKRPENVEAVLTGRHAPPEIIERADLVTEMREVKHYYNAGVPSRVGIED
ncbi:MAG: cob(I)yrinic acid a,c-diamide adenosyltransferase [Clostridiales Family XIII bacterium]|jgi:cob(I)alamin adenosyltransferase|nr:cob(I)yrinic acid a,c-diamide adenosyltransferase [Clostridiales Family XIII bacterium]